MPIVRISNGQAGCLLIALSPILVYAALTEPPTTFSGVPVSTFPAQCLLVLAGGSLLSGIAAFARQRDVDRKAASRVAAFRPSMPSPTAAAASANRYTSPMDAFHEEYPKLECEAILASTDWPPDIIRSAKAMNAVGAYLSAGDFSHAKDLLEQVFAISDQWFETETLIPSKPFPRRDEYNERYLQFSTSSRRLLELLP